MWFPVSYALNLKNGDKILQKSEESSLQISFGQEGEQLLTATITKGDCTYQVEKSITTYQSSIVYIGGKEDAFQLNYDQNFAEQGKYFSKIFVDTTTTEEDIKTLLRKEIRNLSHANTIIIKDANFDQILHTYIELLEQGLIETTKKELFIVSPTNQAFINRVLSLFIKDLWPQQIATVKNSDFLNFLTALSLNQEEEKIKAFAQFHSLQDESAPRYLLLSYLVDEAINNGISLQILGTLLLISLLVLMISTLRQGVGLSVFGVYQPLLFALTLFFIGWKATLFFSVIAIGATALVRIFSKHIHLLQSIKISLLICLYSMLLLIGFWMDYHWEFGLLSKSLRNNGFIVLPILLLGMVSDKLFTDSFKLTALSGRIALGEFIITTGFSRRILQSQWRRTLMLSYPELLLAVLLAIIIIGRFTGLQIIELFRFMPLIRRHLEDEEE